MTLHAAGHIIENRLYAKMGIPESAVRLIESSWEAEPPSLYGRFDLAYDGSNPPKLLEYNADTPTSLLEAAVVQWYWLQDVFPSRDQFNSIHERLIAAVFKLYSWEWMVREDFGKHLGSDRTIWIEPPWKMLLSNKGMLPVLWELYPRHPNLLEARFDDPGKMTEWVRKPLLGREGANITHHQAGADVETAGHYGAEGFIFQELAALNRLNGMHAVIGSWVIGHAEDSSCGIGVRESESPIITNASRFVPHQIG